MSYSFVPGFQPIDFAMLTNPEQAGKAGPVGFWRSHFNGRDYVSIRHLYQNKVTGQYGYSNSGVTVSADNAAELLAALTTAMNGNAPATAKPAKPAKRRNGKASHATA